MSNQGPERFVRNFFCDVHRKMTHPSRWAARRAARITRDAKQGLREYRCSVNQGGWHNGSLPPPVRRGEMTMDEWWALSKRDRRELYRRENDAQLAGPEQGDDERDVPDVEDVGPAPVAAGSAGRDDAEQRLAVPAGPVGGLAYLHGGAARLSPGLRRGNPLHEAA